MAVIFGPMVFIQDKSEQKDTRNETVVESQQRQGAQDIVLVYWCTCRLSAVILDMTKTMLCTQHASLGGGWGGGGVSGWGLHERWRPINYEFSPYRSP